MAVSDLDNAQKQAYAADRNAVVSAGAGSGKTTVLSERYVRLVTERGFKVSEILTLTFTRKAASEMRDRIFKNLSQKNHPLAAEALAQFDQARIGTLDSFCSGLIRGASYRYGIPGDFRIDAKQLQKTAEETAIEIIMRERARDAIRRLVSARTFNTVVGDLFADIALHHFSLVKQVSYTDLAQAQIRHIESEAEKCAARINEYCEIILAGGSAAKGKGASDTLQKMQAAARKNIPLPLAFDTERIHALIETADFFASQDSFRRVPKSAKDSVLCELKEPSDALKEDAKKLQTLSRTLLFREDIPAIGAVLDQYKELFLGKKRQMGILSFHDTLEMAIDVLTRDTGLRSYYKKHIKAIMIDEFQDNNESQKQLLYLLAEKEGRGAAGEPPQPQDLELDKLFFVGDEKQSIYAFRGADVSVFRKLSKELEQPAPSAPQTGGADGDSAPDAPSLTRGSTANDPASGVFSPPAPLPSGDPAISLSTNYRSAPELVDFFNAIFPAVFGKPEEDYDADFSPIEKDPKKKPSAAKPVEIYLQEKSKADEESRSKATGEALAAAERIIAGVIAGEFKFGDVAVLFRSSANQNEYERTFRQAGIPFTAADPRGIYAEGPANDFYAIVRLSIFPLDTNAYAAVLRSPFAGLDDECVFRILLDNPTDPFPQDAPASWFATAAEKARYERGRSIFAALKSRIDLEPVAPLLSFLWYETGYRTYLLNHAKTRPLAGHFEYLYALALDADARQLSVGAFLDELAPLIGTTEKTETGEPPDAGDEVLFMTVHKSKGLGFPVIILADSGSAGMGERNAAPYYLSPKWGPVINFKQDIRRNESIGNYFYESIKEEIQKRETAELKRVFYVACTRAKKLLIVLGTRDVTKTDEEQLLDNGAPLETRERLEKLAALPHVNKNGEPYKKTFLDLLALGLAAAEGAGASRAETGSPSYEVFPINAPTNAEYSEQIAALKEKTSRLFSQKTEAPITAEQFYALEGKPMPSATVLFTTPTAIERQGEFFRHPGPRGWVDRLPPFKCQALLESDDDKKENRRLAFGTLCHSFIEAALPRQDAPPAKPFFAGRLFPDISDKNAQELTEEAAAIAQKFLASEIGREAAASACNSEYEFLLPLSAGKSPLILVQGKIDLIYEAAGRCVIVDFKTDGEIRPEAHRYQLACYAAAAASFSDLPPQPLLVYLRSMEAVPFAPNVSPEELYMLAKEAAEGHSANANAL